MKLIFVRHGQTIGNATGIYDTSYHGDLSDLGKAQAERLAERLKVYTFDAILCSPAKRTMETILPYLKANHLRAEIWPELFEGIFAGRVEIPDELKPYFYPREGIEDLVFPLKKDLPNNHEIIQESVDRIIESYGGRECRILVVGHYHQGGRFIEAFLGLEMRGRFDHENTGMTSLKEQDGIFRIEYLNRI